MAFDRVRRLSAGISSRIAILLPALVAGAGLFAAAAVAQERACTAEGGCETAEGFVQGPAGPVWTEFEKVDGVAVIEGDIAVELVGAGGRSATRPGWTWPGGIIPYAIAAGSDVNVIQAAIAHWNASTGIQLVPRGAEPNYVEFFRGDGCWSYIGRQGGRQQISLGIGCDFGAAVHEIGHAAGLWHEQTRHDRDQFVVVRLENVQPGMEHNFTLYPDGRDEGPYDYGSIMHYPPYGFSRNGLPTLEPRQPGVVIGQRNGLSAGDRSGIAALYGFTPPPAERTELQNGVPVYDLAGAVFEELRFFLVVPDGVRSLEFATSAGTGDADLYVRRENDPSFDSYDCRPFLSGGAESCRFDAPAAGTYHVMLRAYTAFSGVSLTGSYEMPGGAGLVSGKLLKLKQFAHAPQKDKIVFKSSDSSIAAPPAASSADPMQGGGRLVLANPATGEVAYLELPAGSWSRNAKGHLVSSGLCSVKVKAAGKLSVACEGTNLGFTLDEAYQGSLAVKLELGSGVSYCAVFGGEIVKDSGIGWDSEGSAGRFQAKDAPRPASCPY